MTAFAILHVQRLTKTYATGAGKLTVLKDISFVLPAGGTCSILMRTGIRCASRTQVKIGSTFGRPCVLLAAFAALMPPVMLSTLPLTGTS